MLAHLDVGEGSHPQVKKLNVTCFKYILTSNHFVLEIGGRNFNEFNSSRYNGGYDDVYMSMLFNDIDLFTFTSVPCICSRLYRGEGSDSYYPIVHSEYKLQPCLSPIYRGHDYAEDELQRSLLSDFASREHAYASREHA